MIKDFIEKHKIDCSIGYFKNCIIQADPTQNNQKWLLENILRENIKWEDVEDGYDSRTYEALSNLNKIKGIDIKNLSTLEDIEAVCLFYKSNIDNSFNNDEILNAINNTDFIYNNNGLVVSPKNKESAIYCGKNTEWKISLDNDNNSFEMMSKKTPIYICILPNNEKFLFRDNANFFDSKNNTPEINNNLLKHLALYTGSNINKIKDIDYSNQLECELAVKKYRQSIKKISKNDVNYEKYCLIHCKNHVDGLADISNKNKNYNECCIAACKFDGRNIAHVPKTSKVLQECQLEACKQNGINLKSVSDKSPIYDKCCIAAVESNPKYIELIKKDSSIYNECFEIAKKISKTGKNYNNKSENIDKNNLKDVLNNIDTNIIHKKEKSKELSI